MSLKRHSKMAAEEHDESDEEKVLDMSVAEASSLHEEEFAGFPNPSPNVGHHEKFVNEINFSPLIEKNFGLAEQEVIDMLETRANENAALDDSHKEKNICELQADDLVDGARVLVRDRGLFSPGSLKPIEPPDVYKIIIDGGRDTRQILYCQEDLFSLVLKEIKPGSTRYLKEGTRVCAFWSTKHRDLYAGTIAAASSPSPGEDHNSVNVEFDDGDTSRCHIDDIRCLPRDFPHYIPDPNPLTLLKKRKRRSTTEYDIRDLTKNPGLCASTPSVLIRKPYLKTFIPKLCSSAPNTYTNTLNSSAGTQHSVAKTPSPSTSIPNQCTGTTNSSLTPQNSASRPEPMTSDTNNIQNNASSSIGSLITESNMVVPDPDSGRTQKHNVKRKHHKHKRKHKDKSSGVLLPKVEPGSGELRVRITSPSVLTDCGRDFNSKNNRTSLNSSSDSKQEDSSEEICAPSQKIKKHRNSTDKSKFAAFLPESQLWKWAGDGKRRGKSRKTFYKGIYRANEHIKVRDCAVFLSTNQSDRPYIGEIEKVWETVKGKMEVKVKWFYHPEETEGLNKTLEPKGALFESNHCDNNDVQTISHKCWVETLSDFYDRKGKNVEEGDDVDMADNTYYVAGFYDPVKRRITMTPGIS